MAPTTDMLRSIDSRFWESSPYLDEARKLPASYLAAYRTKPRNRDRSEGIIHLEIEVETDLPNKALKVFNNTLASNERLYA